jgi:hypothetical protein
MDLLYGVKQVMHRIRVKLYPNYLPGYENTFHALTENEAVLNLDELCAARRDRGGFTGNFGDLKEHGREIFEEVAYQIADGFAVNLGFGVIYPKLGGLFKNIHETPDPKKHPLTFHFRPTAALRKIAETINVIVEGEADVSGYIHEFYDHENNATNGVYEPGNQFVLTGQKIKIAGDDVSCGMYLIPVGVTDTPVKVTRMVENSPGKLIGIIPETAWAFSKIEIRTQYAGSGNTFLKAPRVITSKFQIEHV